MITNIERRTYSKIDRGAMDNLARSPGESGLGQDTQKELHQRTERVET
jgi:hypothetical protein